MSPKDAPYRLAQRVEAPVRLLASSAQLRKYQLEHKTSALHIARLARAELGQS